MKRNGRLFRLASKRNGQIKSTRNLIIKRETKEEKKMKSYVDSQRTEKGKNARPPICQTGTEADFFHARFHYPRGQIESSNREAEIGLFLSSPR